MLQAICAEIGYTWHMIFEVDFILWFQSLGGGADGSFIGKLIFYLMQFFTLFGEELLLIAIMGFIYWGLDKKRGEKIAVMLLTTTLFTPLLKNIVKRTRPFDSVPEIQNLKDVHGYSFPSGHTSGATSIFAGTAVVFRDKKQKWLTALAIVIPFLVALSRNYLGAHYLTDVICGAALAVGIVFLLDWLLKIVPNKYFVYSGVILVGLSGMFFATTEDYFTGMGLLLGFICGILFEEKIVKFENTKVWWQIIIRLAIGGILYLGLNELIKLPFDSLIFERMTISDETVKVVKDNMVWFERIFRTIRYAVIIFVLVGVYPMLFKYFDKLSNLVKSKVKQSAEQSVSTQETEIESDDSQKDD